MKSRTTRRDFVGNSLKLVAAGLLLPPFLRSGVRAEAARAGLPSRLREAADSEVLDGKILVIVNLSGGNDGLNTVVPVNDPLYHAMRPTLAISSSEAVMIESDTGLHPSLAPLAPLYAQGRLAVVQGVTYPNPNLSHFRSTDIWLSGSSADEVVTTGWLARFLEAAFPDFPDIIPAAPYGLQQGLGSDLPFHGDEGTTGVVVDNPYTFFDLVSQSYTGEWNDELPDTRGGDELGYVREVDVASFHYAGAIRDAAELGTNTVEYPETPLGIQLEIVTRLISGELDTPIYVTAQDGFDTHVTQAGNHASLLSSVADALSAFIADLDNQGLSDRVVVVTTSEFGRRPEENGGYGTEHGTAAPLIVIGDNVNGGMFGGHPDLSDLDDNGNVALQHDFRQVYASILRDHFGASDALVASVLLGEFETVDFLGGVVGVDPTPPPPVSRLHGVIPNPVSLRQADRVGLRVDLAQAGAIHVRVFDIQGRQVADLGGRTYPAGRHRLIWEVHNLPAGIYIAQLRAEGVEQKQKVHLIP